MKKTLLSFCLSAGVIAGAFAQVCAPGYHTTGIADDYNQTAQYGTTAAGVYFFDGVGTVGPPNCTAHSVAADRNVTNVGKNSLTMNLPYGCYVPFGYSFGKTATGAQVTVDLTTDKTFSIDVKNLAADTSSLTFRISIADSLGHLIDTYAAAGPSGAGGGNCNNAYNYTISTLPLAPGASATLSGTFAGGYTADYSKTLTQAAGTSGTNCYLNNQCNFALVSKILFMITNSKQNTADNYNPYAAGNAGTAILTMDNLKVGACVTATTTAIDNSLISVYPNPAKEQITIDLSSLNNPADASVKIMNSNGMLVYEGNATTINTSSFNKGIYLVQVSEGNKVSNKKVVIE